MSSLSIGIVGLPNVGKSTLFNALTKNNILAANYPFATIEPNVGIVAVPDERLDKLAEIYKSDKIVPATVKFVDIAGLVAGASQGEGLGNKFLANIRECNAIVHIVRAFDDDNVIHVDNKLDPKKDIETINTELILSDIQTIENHLPKLVREAKSNPKLKSDINYLNHLLENLNQGIYLNSLDNLDHDLIDHLNLITIKPVIYLFNVDENKLNDKSEQEKLESLVSPNQALFVCAKLESELIGLSPDEADELLISYGIEESGLVKLARASYNILGLQSYLTAGPKEVRAWTIKKGMTAPEAAGVIHTDFEKGFIAAQIVNYKNLIESGSEQLAKAAGKIRIEGRDYIMQPDDVVEFRFNV